jgi:tRNA 2-thiouridine synthesizing protein E
MRFDVNGKTIETDEQGFLLDLEEWSEDFARALAAHDGIELYVDHWELIWYFRDYYEETQTVPTMRKMILELGQREGARFRDRKAYEKHIYGLFHTDPVRSICRLAGLPMPQADT